MSAHQETFLVKSLNRKKRNTLHFVAMKRQVKRIGLSVFWRGNVGVINSLLFGQFLRNSLYFFIDDWHWLLRWSSVLHHYTAWPLFHETACIKITTWNYHTLCPQQFSSAYFNKLDISNQLLTRYRQQSCRKLAKQMVSYQQKSVFYEPSYSAFPKIEMDPCQYSTRFFFSAIIYFQLCNVFSPTSSTKHCYMWRNILICSS
jgi:hypothetical protein